MNNKPDNNILQDLFRDDICKPVWCIYTQTTLFLNTYCTLDSLFAPFVVTHFELIKIDALLATTTTTLSLFPTINSIITEC